MTRTPAHDRSHASDQLHITLGAGALKNLEHFSLGLIRVDREKRVTFSTPSMDNIVGFSMRGKRVGDFVVDTDSAHTLDDHVFQRFDKGQASEYDINVINFKTRQAIPVRVVGIPEIGPDGTVSGAIALVRDQRLYKAAEAIHCAIATETNHQQLLSCMADALAEVVPFDKLYITVYSNNKNHVRQFFGRDANKRKEEWIIRWWEVKNYMRSLLDKTKPYIYDPVKIMEDWRDPDLLKEEDIKRLKKENMRSAVRIPIRIGDRISSELYLMRRGRGKFGDDEVKALDGLPISEVVSRALHLDNERHNTFLQGLIARFASEAEHGLGHIAQITVDELARHFEWPHVSVLCPEERESVTGLRVLAQRADGEAGFREGFWQPVSAGLLGEAYRTRAKVVAGDVTSKVWADKYKQENKKTRSELCYPVFDDRFFWVVNVEDAQRNAFADMELEVLSRILSEVRAHVQRVAMLEHWRAAFEAVNDALLITDARGQIKLANPACKTLFRREVDTLIGQSIATLFRDEIFGDAVATAPEIQKTECELRVNVKSTVAAMVSCRTLTAFPEKVYVITDLTMRKEIEKIATLKNLFHEIAQQTKVPLSIAASLVKRARSAVEGDVQKMLGSVLPYLRKVDLTFDRMLFFERDISNMTVKREPVDVQEIVDAVLQQAPETDVKRIDRPQRGERYPKIRGDDVRLAFCIESILSYLLRAAPQESPIGVTMEQEGSTLAVSLSIDGLDSAPAELDDRTPTDWLSAASSELASAMPTIRKLVELQGGTVVGPESCQRGWGYRIELAVA